MRTTGSDDLTVDTRSVPAADQPVPDEFDLLCEHCGYSLVGLTASNRCPECGEEFDPNDLPLARVPWLFRVRRGRITSYIQTFRLILENPTAFAKELCRPVRVSAEDARLFRRFTIRIAMLSCVLGALIVGVAGLIRVRMRVSMSVNQNQIVGVLIFCVMVPWSIFLINVMFRLMTDLPTFIWSGLNGDPLNLAPLHHYASAPLALSPILLVPTTMLALLGNGLISSNSFLVLGSELFAIGGTAVIGLLLWIMPLRFMKTATGCTVWRVLALALYLPLHWLLSFILAAAAFGATLEILGELIQTVLKWRP